MTKFISTRGGTPPQSFTDVLLQGLAPDGGLFIPESWPQIDIEDLRNLSGVPYAEVAHKVISPFIGDDIDTKTLKKIINEVYADNFDHACVAPTIVTRSPRSSRTWSNKRPSSCNA